MKLRDAAVAAAAWIKAQWDSLSPNARENIKYIAAGVVLGVPVGVWLA